MSIVVPCRNEAEYIEACLKSILAQEGVLGGYEILVADGKSGDGTRRILEGLAASDTRVRIVDNPRRIASTGLNAAIRNARGEIVVRMDVHAEYARDYVARCLDALEQTGADNVGGPARTKGTTYFQRANALAFHSPFSAGGARFHDPSFEGWVDTVTYGCWRKDTIERLGLFDEELVRNQDDELNLRLLRAGGRIWQSPKIRSWYYPRASIRALFTQYAQYGYWKVRVIQKHRLPASVRHLVPGAFVAMLIGLAALSFVYAWARLLLVVLLATYLLISIAATLVVCRRTQDLGYGPVMPVVFAAYHCGYGWGFLRGVVDFVVLRRSSGRKFAVTTR